MSEIMNITTIVGALAAVIAAGFSYIMWRIDRVQDLSMLKALYQHLNFIDNSANGHETHVRNNTQNPRRSPMPSWPLPNMDLNFYLTHIKYKIRKEWSFCKEPTESLKMALITLHERVNTINFLWREELSRRNSTDLRTNTYYQDLKNDINQCTTEIRRIIKLR